MFLSLTLDRESLLFAVGLHSDSDGLIENAADHIVDLARDFQTVAFREFQQRFAKHIVFGDHFDEIEPFIETLNSMDLRARVRGQLHHRPRVAAFQRFQNVIEHEADMVVQSPNIQRTRRGNLLHLIAPALHQLRSLIVENVGQFLKIPIRHIR